MRSTCCAFTLIETMLAILLLAILVSAAALTFSAPIADARFEDAVALVQSFDRSARVASADARDATQLVIDLDANRLERGRGDGFEAAFAVSLPSGCRIDAVRTGADAVHDGRAHLALSPMGFSQTYAVHLTSKRRHQWMLFAGLTGETAMLSDEAAVEQVFQVEHAH